MSRAAILERMHRIFLHDPWRKGSALLLAAGVWFLAVQNTTARYEKDLVVRTLASSDPVPLTPGILWIRVVPGMRLVSAPPIHANIKGPRREIDRIDAVSGLYDPGPSFEGGQIVLTAESIDWHPRRVRDFVRGIDPPQVKIEFGKVERREVYLDPKVLEVKGEPAPGYEKHPERARFYPSRVFVRGLRRDLSVLDGPEGFRLAPIEIDGNSSSAVLRVGLHPDIDLGLELDPASVEVEIPIEPVPNEVRFRAHVAAVFTDANRSNSRPPFVLADEDREREFVLSFRGPSPFQPPGPEGAALHVQIFVDLAEITPKDAASTTVSEVELSLRHFFRSPGGERAASPIQIRPADGRGMTARVIRKGPE